MSEIMESKSLTSAVFQPLVDRIFSPPISEFIHRLKLGKMWLDGFKSNLLSFDAIFDDAELKAYDNKQVKTWVDELSEVSYDVKALPDEISKKPRVINFSDKLIPLEEIIKQRLIAIAVKIEDLQTQGDALGLREASPIIRKPFQLSVGREDLEDESQEIGRDEDESQVIGRDEDKIAILKLLLSDGHQTDVITMVGEDGVGKTTLAQLDFDDLLLTKAILHAFTYPSDTEDLDSLQNSLKDHLKKKKFLLVLDNLTMRSDWRNLQKVLTDGANGSRIIVTTCHPQLEETMAGTLPAFTVRSLTDQESWMLFAKHAFPDKSSSLLPKLEDIGKEIVEKCCGLPLAVKILASVLRFKPVKEWHAELNNNSILKWDEDPLSLILKILKMCYNDLPIHLKRCAAYCSIFPTHHEYEEEKLILLWKAEGFLQPKGDLSHTAITEIPFNSLKNLDKLQKLLLSNCYRLTKLPDSFRNLKNLQLLDLSHTAITEIPYIVKDLDKLQKLLLSNCYGLTELPDSFGYLKNLQFIDISHTAITKLPDSVSFLPNLQIVLPENMGKLINLRPLDSRGEFPEVEGSKLVSISERPKLEKFPLLRVPIMGNTQLHDYNDKLAGVPLKELQLPDSNVVQRTDVSITSKIPPPEFSKRLTEDSSAKHGGASAATEISSSDTENPIDAVESFEDIETSKSPPPESPKHLTEDSSAKHGGASAATEISSSDTDMDDPIDVSEISQLKRLPPNCIALKLKVVMPSKSIHESHLPIALKTLYISKSKKLELEFLSSEYTSIEHLCIESSCDSLESFPLSSFPKLRNLSIRDCANFTSISIGLKDHMSLYALEIRDCPELTSFPVRIPNLTSILLSNCKNLKELPDQLHGLTSLQSLFMKECPELESIPGGLPSSLNLLCISSCQKLMPRVDWGLHKLYSFSCIEIEGGCTDLESFPEQNLLPMNLTSLRISRLMNLKFLDYNGLQHLTSLETLKINSCGKLQSFPAEGLPSSLSYLYISDCPLLKSKLQNRRGKEWYKIAHIPHIQIDMEVIS
ncbi:hypothetical protein EZV62_017244 [Acer yangbiense]|uniref:NB-ARC domain-containing protein n=1 Tax=Acer yangbiense TaxID=1000413 RepID=A0A5C7HG53_9ROSI|nr:hypothetical protein EZV62_017244 [Acer yangbiense]